MFQSCISEIAGFRTSGPCARPCCPPPARRSLARLVVAVARVAVLGITPIAGALAQSTPPLQLDVSTYTGSRPVESGRAAAVDDDGNLVVVGDSWYLEDRTPPNRSGTVQAYDADVYIARYAAQDGALLGFAWLGGDGRDQVSDVAIAGNGDIVVVGRTNSRELVLEPAPPSGSARINDNEDGFLAVIGKGLDSIEFSTRVAGSDDDRITGVAIEGSGRIHVSGTTASDDLDAVNAMRTVSGGNDDGFVAGFTSADDDGSRELLYLTYLGGRGDDALNAIAIAHEKYDLNWPEREGNVLVAVAGMTESPDLFENTSDGIRPVGSLAGWRDALVTVVAVDPTGTTPVFELETRYYGSSGGETATALATSETGDLFVAGRVVDLQAQTRDPGSLQGYSPLPTSWETSHDIAIQGTYQGGDSDGFVLRLHQWEGQRWWGLVFSTYLGGNSDDSLSSIAFDGTWIHVAGTTRSDNGKLIDDEYDGLPLVHALSDSRGTAANGVQPADGFYARIGSWEAATEKDNNDSSHWWTRHEISMATYLGGGENDSIHDIVATDESVWLVGQTASGALGDGFPVAPRGEPLVLGGDVNFEPSGVGDWNFGDDGWIGDDAFVVRLVDTQVDGGTPPGRETVDSDTVVGEPGGEQHVVHDALPARPVHAHH